MSNHIKTFIFRSFGGPPILFILTAGLTSGTHAATEANLPFHRRGLLAPTLNSCADNSCHTLIITHGRRLHVDFILEYWTQPVAHA